MRNFRLIGILLLMIIDSARAETVFLGDVTSKVTWVYLCGLTDDNNSPQDLENREILDRIGKRRGIRFLALHPFDRCSPADNKFCWKHYSIEQAHDTFNKIISATNGLSTAGFLGFSNGGFFLNEMAQLRELGVPIISVGAAGSYRLGGHANKITLIVGREEYVYPKALDLVEKAKGSKLSLRLVEHSGDHILPEQELEDALRN